MLGNQLTQIVTQRLRRNRAKFSVGLLQDFTHLTEGSVSGWLRERNPTNPERGIITIKLWHLMALAGVKSPELQDAMEKNPYGGYIGQLLAFEVITPDDAIASFGYFVGKDQVGSVYRHVRAEMSKGLGTPEISLDELHKMYDTDLEKKKAFWLERISKSEPETKVNGAALHTPLAVLEEEPLPPRKERSDTFVETKLISPDSSTVFSPSRLLTEPESDDATTTRDSEPEALPSVRLELVMQVAQQLSMTLPPALLAIEEFTDAERALLRKLTGRTIFDLGNAVEGLSSARSLEHLRIAQSEGK